MSAKELVLNRNCSLLRMIPSPYAGLSLNVAGRESTDYNVVLQDFFKSVVMTEPNEDEEDTIGVLYLTRSEYTRQRVNIIAQQQRSLAGLEYIVKTYNKFHATEILDIMADIDRMTFRYVIIEDVDGYGEDTILGMRKLREAAEKNFFLLTSSRLGKSADEIMSIENDSVDFLKMVQGKAHDRLPKLTQEVDIQLLVEPTTLSEEGTVSLDFITSKFRGVKINATVYTQIRELEIHQ